MTHHHPQKGVPKEPPQDYGNSLRSENFGTSLLKHLQVGYSWSSSPSDSSLRLSFTQKVSAQNKFFFLFLSSNTLFYFWFISMQHGG